MHGALRRTATKTNQAHEKRWNAIGLLLTKAGTPMCTTDCPSQQVSEMQLSGSWKKQRNHEQNKKHIARLQKLMGRECWQRFADSATQIDFYSNLQPLANYGNILPSTGLWSWTDAGELQSPHCGINHVKTAQLTPLLSFNHQQIGEISECWSELKPNGVGLYLWLQLPWQETKRIAKKRRHLQHCPPHFPTSGLSKTQCSVHLVWNKSPNPRDKDFTILAYRCWHKGLSETPRFYQMAMAVETNS